MCKTRKISNSLQCDNSNISKSAIVGKDDTLPCKCQALAWENEPKAWIQGFQAWKIVFGCIVFLLL